VFDPLALKPKADRLTVAVRGPAGSGKSTFAASAQELPGRLLFLDLEGKSRLLPGATADVPPFDAVSLRNAGLLVPSLGWLLDGEGRGKYRSVALDSWAVYFADSYAAALSASGRRELSAEQEQALQVTVQGVLRRLCFESGLNVVITDVIAARNKETSEANELGRVIPLTASGLEYMVDVVADLDLLMTDGFRPTRALTVTKSNIPELPVGFRMVNPSFAKLLAAAGITESAVTNADVGGAVSGDVSGDAMGVLLDDDSILRIAADCGFVDADVNLVISRVFGKSSVTQLSNVERLEIVRRMRAARST
jgi:hypothetical protein